MKTAVSVPDPIFERAEAMADRLGISRSELYARALDTYLRELESDDMTEQINEVVREVGAEATRVDDDLARHQERTLRNTEW